jgi:hypothetical protein
MVADIPPWEQAADVLKALAAILSAVALPVALVVVIYLLRGPVSGILDAVRDKVKSAEKVEVAAGGGGVKVATTAPPKGLTEKEVGLAEKVEALSDRRLPKKPPGPSSPPSPRSRGSRRS